MTYSQKLRDPRWQKIREKVLLRDQRRCVRDPAHQMPLEVHHKTYGYDKEPWDYPLENFITLCRDCHIAEHESHAPISTTIGFGFYAWHHIKTVVGIEPHGYLTESPRGHITCGCFQMDLNPEAPDIILPGTRSDWKKKAILFQRQKSAIPIFVKGEGLPWEYVGNYAVDTITQNQVEISIHRERSQRKDISMIVFLKREIGG